jgi:hypothetical protein
LHSTFQETLIKTYETQLQNSWAPNHLQTTACEGPSLNDTNQVYNPTNEVININDVSQTAMEMGCKMIITTMMKF